MGTSTHYVDIFAVYCLEEKMETVMLTFAPLIEETSLNAESHLVIISYAFDVYGK